MKLLFGLAAAFVVAQASPSPTPVPCGTTYKTIVAHGRVYDIYVSCVTGRDTPRPHPTPTPSHT